MCDPISATLAVGAAASLGGGLLSSKAQDDAAAATIERQNAQANKQQQLAKQNARIAEQSAQAAGGGTDAAAVAAREQSKAKALAANAPGVDVNSPLAGQSSFVQSELNKAVGAEGARVADESARGDQLAAFGDRMREGNIASGIAGSRIASNNAASQFLDSMPVYAGPGTSPLGDILSAVGGTATTYAALGAPGVGGAAAKGAASHASRTGH